MSFWKIIAIIVVFFTLPLVIGLIVNILCGKLF